MPRPRIHYHYCQRCGVLIPADHGELYCSRACYFAHRRQQSEQSAADRLAAHTVKSEGCWEWQGARVFCGYGVLNVGGRRIGAHRLSYELHNGPVPGGLDVLHHCDNPPCVRPDHLFLGTAKDNTQDMMAKGRGRYLVLRGEACTSAKLTRGQVETIRREYSAGGISQSTIARQYGMSQSAIGALLRGESWKDDQDA